MKYEIQGGTLPVVICQLADGERMITEGGAMSWMSPNMKMETTSNGGIGKAFGRAVSGEKLFQNLYTATNGNGMIAFASCFQIYPRIPDYTGNEMIFQKKSFLASEAGVTLSMHFRKKIGSGLFGGEGFIMQKVSGQGIVFAEFDGHVSGIQSSAWSADHRRHRTPCSHGCHLYIWMYRLCPGMKNMLFGGEGIFNTVVTGPGRIWLQTMPISNVAGAIRPYIPTGK